MCHLRTCRFPAVNPIKYVENFYEQSISFNDGSKIESYETFQAKLLVKNAQKIRVEYNLINLLLDISDLF